MAEIRPGRRTFLAGGVAALGAGVAACTSNSKKSDSGANVRLAGDNAKAGKHVTIGFSCPAADHGWIGAISKNAQAQAKLYKDVSLQAVEPTNDINQQIAAVETLVTKKVDVLVILPNDGAQLTAAAQKAMDAGIPVINLDRVFSTALAYRTWIGGDNYGMGVAAGNYIAKALNGKGDVVEIAGIDSLPLTQQRSKGFKDALAKFPGIRIVARQAAQFTVESGQQVAANVLQAAPKFDAMWNHDDDQGVGVLAAIHQAGRKDFLMVGGAGSANAMRMIKADNDVLKATVTYPPSMASSAISLARLVAQGKGMSDLVEADVPAFITLQSATVTKANVDQYLKTGFES
jgi:ribose transport system substrate-binding protein